MPPLARRRYRFSAAMRREYPAAKAFLAPQRGGVPAQRAVEVVSRDRLPIREGLSRARDHRGAEVEQAGRVVEFVRRLFASSRKAA